jgi:signal transduction histidine kinase
VAVAPLLGEVVEAAAARTAAGIQLVLASGLPDLRGDRMLLREALLNIVSNAGEASDAVVVTARTISAGAAPVVKIDVADSGDGIPRADLARVFAPGFTTKESGSGIGLAIAERVVAAHHGRIALDSEVGRGTRVTVLLPSDLGGFAGLGAFSYDRGEGGVT